MNTAEEYIKEGWPICLKEDGRSGESKPIKSLHALSANRRFRPQARNILFTPQSVGMIAFKAKDYHEGIQALINIWKISNAPKRLIETARIEGKAGESVWLWKLPRQATPKRRYPTQKWGEIVGALKVKYSSPILLPPSEVEGKRYVWDGKKAAQVLPMEVVNLTGMFHDSAFHAKHKAVYQSAVGSTLRSPEGVIRVKKGVQMMLENRWDEKFEDYLDSLADVFDRVSDLTPNEGLLIFSHTATYWNNMTTLAEVVHFVGRYQERLGGVKIPVSKQLKLTASGLVDNSVGNAVLIAEKLYGETIYTDERNGNIIVEGDILSGNIITDFQIRSGEYQAKFSSGTSKRALEYVASRKSSSPPVRWIESIEWDGSKRIDGLLTNYLSAPHTKLSEGISRWFMLSAVYALTHPASPQPFLPVLCGQWAGTILEILGGKFVGPLGAPGWEWIKDKWLVAVEMGRLAKPVIDFMAQPYHKSYPKSCFFVGFSPKDIPPAWQTNAMSNRVIVLNAKKVNEKELTEDVEQMWAEALAAVKAGETPTLSDGAKNQVSLLRKKKAASDEWYEAIVDWSHDRFMKGMTFSTDDILVKVLSISRPTWQDRDRVDSIMSAAGAEKMENGDWHG